MGTLSDGSPPTKWASCSRAPCLRSRGLLRQQETAEFAIKHAYLIIRLHLDISCGALDGGASRGTCSCCLLAWQDMLHVRRLCSCMRHDISIVVSPIAVCARRHWCLAECGIHAGLKNHRQAGRAGNASQDEPCLQSRAVLAQQVCREPILQTGLFPASSSHRAQEQARSAALTFARDVRCHLSQHSLQVCQRVPEGKSPAGCRTLAQVVCML